MDFFQHQQQARKRTMLLVVLYALAVVLLVAAIYALAIVFVTMGGSDEYARQLARQGFFEPTVFLWTVGGVCLLVLGGSWFKIAELSSGGGRSVAEMLGGRQISPAASDPAERRLYNVVEEMSLASGIPVPAIYIMDNEPGINAFAAGFSPQEAVIGVNRGTVELLTRDELQGVIAHEFSHILNGDMRMNLRLIGILFGLQLLVLLGYYAMRMSYYASMGSRSSDGKNSGAGIGMVMLLGGLGVIVIGSIGMFFSAVIKAAISRQREFLADASAVQFTRNPDGIAGALKKIGCPNVGSDIQNEHAAEASHLFFGNVCSMFSLGNLLATHPDLTTRIRRVDPKFDGRFPSRIERINFYEEPVKRSGDAGSRMPGVNIPGITNVLGNIGTLNPAQVMVAGALLQSIPEDVADAARDPLTAKAVFYAALLDADETLRRKQIDAVAAHETPFVVQQTQRLFERLRNLAPEARIPLVQRISASLRTITPDQYRRFSGVVDLLIAADDKMDLFEYTLKAILLRDLDVHFGFAKPVSVKYSSLAAVREPFADVLAFLAYSGHGNIAHAREAFEAAQKELGLSGPMPGDAECSVKRFDASLRVLAETAPALKKQLFSALMTCVRFDGQITVKEGELIRAVAAMLAIPMPNFIG